ncbi:MAG: hypothetical protein JWR03_2116 [Cohnella sp.]|nr:hypothetical protein [Cohnella sp.]
MNGMSRKALSVLTLAVLISAAAACGYPNTAQTAQAGSASSESPSATVSSSPMSMSSASESAMASAVPTTDPSSPSASAEVSPSPSATKKPEASKDAHHDSVMIEIKDFAFSPSEVEIKPGTKVTFTNRDKVKHTATADGGEFDTGLLEQDKSKTVTFDKEGTFTFYCSPHPYMTGKIVVKAK